MSFNTPKRTSFVEAEKILRELSCQMCGGEDLDSYLEEFRSQGQSQCTNVWSKGIIAYRCRTCQINDSSAICVSCFQGGNHWEHDYVMYHSESGGCCDCGDRAAWRESGFCSTHQHVHVGDAVVKEELQKITHSVVRYVLVELLSWVIKLKEEPSYMGWRSMTIIYLSWLQKVCAVDALRNIVCNDIVANHVSKQSHGNPASPLDVLLEYLPRMPEIIIEEETTLFLQLLYKNEFKDDFLLVLKNKYEDMIISAVHDKYYLENYKHLDTNLDRVMVQLFNDPDKTTELIHKYNLLELFIGVFCNVVSSCAEKKPAVVTVEKDAIKGKVYLRSQGDLRLIVAHGNIAVSMLIEKPQLFLRILDVLAKLQWMNPYTLVNEIEFENSWTLAIQLEMNSMAIIYQLVSRCYQDPHFGKETLLKAATCTLKSLKQYLKEVASCGPVDTPSKTVSLHIPLHRTLSAILQKLILFPWDGLECGFFSVLDFDYTKEEVLQLMEQPLRISFWMAQIRAQVWRRSSEEFSRLELIYRGSFWHDQSMDMDVLLLQFCSVAHENMQEQVFIRIAEEFNLKSMVTSPLVVDKSRRQSEVVLLQDFIRLILLIVRERRNLRLLEGSDAQDKCLQYDVIQWLCVRDQTYSQLCRALSAVSVDHQKLNAMLEKVAVYHEPKVADRGYYELKPEYWKEFDPLFAHYYLNEMEEAEDRAVKIGKLEQYWRIKAPPAAGAPYDRLSDLLHTKACHLFLMNVLKDVMHLVKLDTSATCGEALGVTALQMLAVLLSDVRHLNRIQCICDCSKHSPSKFIPSAQVQEEFSTENIFVNIHVTLRMQSESHPSIYQMLMQLQQVNNCSRLVDSVNHVLELLCFSADERSFAAEGISLQSQVNSTAVEALKRRLRKEQRQKAILEEFAAKQKAFWDQQDASQDDNFVIESSHMPLPSIVEEAPHFVGVTSTSCGTITDDVVPMMDTHSVSLSALSKTRECVLCRSKSDMEKSSICWIALVQQYNFPSLVLGRKRALEFSSTSSWCQEEKRSEKELVTLVCLSELEESAGSCIDHVTAEHIQCCGHQIHFHCFQEHVKTQHKSQNSGYAGNDLLDLNRVEFLCPICRRLANVVLPDVDTSILYRKLLEDDVNSEEKTIEKLNNFWHFNNNLEKAVDFLSSQTLKVRGQFQHHDVSTSSFINCKVLWEGLALNIVHCEVETREGYVMESASSSSVPRQLLDQHTWGGNPSHWIALRELGKLAMLSNTLPGAAQEKSQMMVALRQSLGLCDKKESKSGTSASNGLIEVERILEEMFPFSLRTPEQPMGSLPTAGVLLKMSHCDAESRLEKISECDQVLHDESVEKLEMRNGTRLGESCLSVPITKSKDMDVGDFDDNKAQQIVAVAPGTHKNQENLTTTLLNTATSIYSASEKAATTSVNKKFLNWTSDILKNDVLAADPFGLLIVLFIIFQGQPQKQVILLMVKFAYTIAVLQTQKAVARLELGDSVRERDLVQRACLPFLRRAALLVQLITQEDFKGKSRSAGNEYGSKVMDSLYLQQALQLPDCTDIMHSGGHGVQETLATALQCLRNPISKRSIPMLYTVPQQVPLHKLPRVFQKLLLENIHHKKSCESCKDMPPDPAICLLCGALLCCGSDCCKLEGVGECSQHAAEESAGIGIFLLLRSTQLLLLRNNRSCMGLSLYLDTHGEPAQEDLHLRRSQLLYLSDLRLNEVRRLWMTASFDYDSYILRNSHSRPMFY